MKKKKGFLAICIAIVTTFVACMGAACDGLEAETCQHDKGMKEVIIINDANCSEEGESIWICEYCGKEIKREVTAGWHDFDDGETTLSPTCTSDGTLTYTCKACGLVKTETLPALGHSFVDDKELAPTCTTTGLTAGKHCSVCGEVVISQQTIEKLKHNFENGENCADCGTEQRTTVLTFLADGATVAEIQYDVNTTEITPPAIPEKTGYTGEWESYSLDYTNATVNVVYTPIVYKIQYVRAGISVTSKSYYIFGAESEYRKSGVTDGVYPTEYTVESGDVTISNLKSYFNCACGGGASYSFKGWYLDEGKTLAFNGTIPAGSTGDIVLYADISMTGTHFY